MEPLLGPMLRLQSSTHCKHNTVTIDRRYFVCTRGTHGADTLARYVSRLTTRAYNVAERVCDVHDLEIGTPAGTGCLGPRS